MPISPTAPLIPSPQEMIEVYRRLADDLEQLALLGPKCVMSPVTISDWVLAKRTVPVLLGTITGHPHIRTGKAGLTTEIVYWNQEENLARTINRWYRLGRPIVGDFSQ